MNFLKPAIIVILLTISSITFSQESTKDDVRLLGNFFIDAAQPSSIYFAGDFTYADFDSGSGIALAGRAGLPITELIDVGSQWAYINRDFDGGGDASGLSALELSARYHLALADNPMKISLGGLFTLPIGADEVGGDSFNFGAFAAMRYPAQDNLVLTGNLGLYSIEVADDREFSLHMGGGAIFELEPTINLIGELVIQTEEEYTMLTGGADIQLDSNIRLRPSLGIGLNDGAPDIQLMGEFLLYLR